MARSSLDRDGKERLTQVMQLIHGDIEEIPKAVQTAIRGVEVGRRLYLKNELERRAKRLIRTQERLSRARFNSFQITPSVVLDAWRHEQELLRNIPEEDR